MRPVQTFLGKQAIISLMGRLCFHSLIWVGLFTELAVIIFSARQRLSLMANPIPDFDHNLVLPAHLGDPTDPSQLSPFSCTSLDLCQKLGMTVNRRRILENCLNFRDRLRAEGLTQGYQWLDGSFLEDVERSEGRSPRDLDIVTIYWGYDTAFQGDLFTRFPEFFNPVLSKAGYLLDHYPLDAGHDPSVTVQLTRYWSQLFSHNRLGVWKGMLQIDLDTPAEDAAARAQLLAATP